MVFAPAIVETHLGGDTWGEVWRHQLRWSRGIRVSRPGGYFGYLVTHATFWSLVAIAAGAGRPAWPRSPSACWPESRWAGACCAIPARSAALAWIPFRDLWGFAIWVCGLAGNTVEWRGARIRLSPDGTILPEQ